jgi:hypothetical protein
VLRGGCSSSGGDFRPQIYVVNRRVLANYALLFGKVGGDTVRAVVLARARIFTAQRARTVLSVVLSLGRAKLWLAQHADDAGSHGQESHQTDDVR